ncbi:MAG TPA: AAA family ATPase [Blastocatellia bacterium]|nr:AAA family ATPase [Blastocatellia bacterium]
MDQEKESQSQETKPRATADSGGDIVNLLSQKVVGQAAVMKSIVPYIHMWKAGLAPEGRPAGVFLLLGPTGTGKTKTVEAIAEVLHGSPKKVLKVDCGEFQMEHEVSKLIGSPPGYLGHRETPARLTQQQLTDATTPQCDLALVLFDEIEKAAPSMTRLLLGILDKAILRLGDNTTVNFEKTLIFFTSNLGAAEMMKEIQPDFGFQAAIPRKRDEVATKVENVALSAVRKRFSPEFVNRIDAIVTYQPLDENSLMVILDQNIDELQKHVNTRLADRCFTMELTDASRQYLLKHGTSAEYGARELKRTIHRQITQPLATMVASGGIAPGAVVQVDLAEDGDGLTLKATAVAERLEPVSQKVLIVDDNIQLLGFIEYLLKDSGFDVSTAKSGEQARIVFAKEKPHTVLMDYMLGDDDGISLGLQLQLDDPKTSLILMTGGELTPEEEGICHELSIPILRKPFLAVDVLNIVRSRFSRASAAQVAG